MQKKENTPNRVARRNYELRHFRERKEKSMVWGTSIERKLAEEINEMLDKYGYTKVQLIKAGYNALLDEVAEHILGLSKITDKYDDIIDSELQKIKSAKKEN